MTGMTTTIVTDVDAPEHDLVLGTEGAAAYLDISLPTLMGLIKSGQLRAARVGRQWRIRRSWVHEFLENAAAAA